MELLNFFSYFLISLSFLQLLRLVLRRDKICNRLPPGPASLPIIGNLLNLGNKPHQSLTNLSKTYGPIMSLKLGQIITIVISSSDMAQEVLQKQDISFSNKFVMDALRALDAHKLSLIFQPINDRWRNLRRLTYTHIFSPRVLDSTQHIRRKKVGELMAYVRKRCGEGASVNVGWAAFQTSLNVLSNTFFSVDLADSERDFKELVWSIIVEAGKPNLVDYFPVLRMIDPQRMRARMTLYLLKLRVLFGGMIDTKIVMKTFLRDVFEGDVIDRLLKICHENPDELDKAQIVQLCKDLFVAGTDTTSSTLEWAMTELLRHPTSMENAKNELKRVVGIGKQVEESDIDDLPYLGAVIKETLRLHPPAPFLIPRQLHTEVDLSGYKIPKGAQVLVNVWAIGRDPQYWESPMEFKPERFIDSKIDVRGHNFELIPFGGGRRICPGLCLTLRLLPTVLGSLINLFDWKIDGNVKPENLDVDEKFGITLQKANPLLAVPIPI